jgi:hypothetical protein
MGRILHLEITMTITIHDLHHVEPDVAEAWLVTIADNLRSTDLDEIEAMSGKPPREVLLESFGLSSHAYVVLDRHSNPVAVFGAAPYPLPGVGIVWMLGTPGIDVEALAIARATRPAFEMLTEAYPLALFNYIDDRNKVSMRWLRWGGFKVINSKPRGPEGLTFHLFSRSK